MAEETYFPPGEEPAASAPEQTGGDSDDALERGISLRRVRRVLDNSLRTQEREQAVENLLPMLWDRRPWRRYNACCALTTRIYLPYGLHPLEWMSFPRHFARALRRYQPTLPAAHRDRRTQVARALRDLLKDWFYLEHRTAQGPGAARAYRSPNMDVGADLCEAVGRLGIYEAEQELLNLLWLFSPLESNQARTAALMALAMLPPARLARVWERLRAGQEKQRRQLAALFTYLHDPDFVPFLLEILPFQHGPYLHVVAQPLVKKLGELGSPRVLPVLNAIARNEPHLQRPVDEQQYLRPTALRAIDTLMKVARGHAEVTLLRASDLSTLDEDILLRAADSERDDRRPEELLRAVEGERGTGPVPLPREKET
jgi:hypothetical protein